MAQSISLTSGSILNGNPITLAVKPTVISGAPSFHRIILEVECGISGGNYEVIKMSSPVFAELGEDVTIDISSALRTFRDTYEYTPDAATYPMVKFNVKAYDEYMLNGEVRTSVGVVYFPQDPNALPAERRDEAYYRTIFGAFSDIERITSEPTKGVTMLSRKPTTTPHPAVVGETFAYTPPYTTEQKLEQSSALNPPQSKVVTISKQGIQTLGYQNIYALSSSAAKDRQSFRFINSFGVLESISVPRAYSKKLAITSNPYSVARPETFNSLSRATVRKQNNSESWLFQTDPLTEEWLSWYLHEFLMSEHVWMYVSLPQGGGTWLPVTITPEEEITFIDHTNSEVLSVMFTAKIDITGKPTK